MVVRWLALAALLACTLAWRMPASPPEWRFALCENDSLYQLHRVEQCLRHFPAVESVDPSSHFPRGYRVPWMPLHTLFYASLVRGAGVPPDDREGIVALVSWVPPLVGLASLLLILGIARCLTRNQMCVFAIGALYAFNADVSRPFVYGTIDHHLFAHAGLLLMVWGRLRLRFWAWLAGALAMLAMTLESIIYVTAVLGCLFLSLLLEDLTDDEGRGRDAAAREPALWAWLLAPALVALATWLAGRGLETEPLPLLDLTWMYPTLFTPLWLAVVGGSMLAALRGLAPRTLARAAAAAGLVAGACALYLLATGALQTTAARLLGGEARLFVAEETSVFHDGFWQAAAGYRLIAFSALWVVYRLVDGLRRGTDRPGRAATWWFGWLVLALSLALGFAEFRHLYVLSSLQLVALGLALFGVEGMLRAMPLFAGRLRYAPALLLAAGTLPFLVSEDLLGRADSSSGVCASMPVIEELAGWLARATPPPGAPPEYGVFASWSIGHHLHVLGERPVVVDPLNYGLDNWVDVALDRVWRARTAEDMARALRDYRVRYLVVTNPTAQIVDNLGADGPDPDDLVERGPGGTVTFKPGMAQFASFRLFMSGGAASEFGELQLRHTTADGEHYTASSASGEPHPVVVPRGQIYEVKPGARIRGALPPGAERVVLRYRLHRRGSEAVEVEIPLTLDAAGRFLHHTSLPAPVREESFAVEGPYRFLAGERTASVEVTQEMVDRGAEIEVGW